MRVPLMAAFVLAACATVPAAERIGGARPSYLEAVTEDVPNRAALGRRIWTPGLDDAYVPQGLTTAGKYLFVSSYHPSRSTSRS